MKKIIWMQAVLLMGLTALWGCGDDDTTSEQPAVMPQVTFPVTESAVSAYVDDAVRFEAVIESPGPLSCSWFVDGKLMASTASMTYVFKAKGTYDVHFEASNTAGKVEKDYSVTVEGSPLKVEFSNEEETISCLPGEEVLITATVVAGDKEVVHAWKVGDEEVSSTAEFKYTFDKMGSYTVAYRGVNADDISFNRTWTVTVDELPLEIEFSVTDATIPCVQGNEVAITATVKNGGTGLTHEWKVGSDVVSTTAEFKHTFGEVGTFTVSYKGVNGKGEEKTGTWTVQVEEKPLEIEFSKADGSTLKNVKGDELAITATVKGGATGLTHEWKVGGDVVSTTTEFKHTFDAAGTYTVTYKGVNTKGEEKTASWTVVVSEDAVGYMFENFETRDALPGHFINGNAAIEGTTLQENPYKTAVNPSNKVLRDLLLKESGTSGFFDMGFSHLTNRSKYRAIRVKVYLGKNEYYPHLQISGKKKLPSKINGQRFTGSMSEADWKTLIKTDDWNVFVYDLVDCGFGAENFENITTVQFRPLSKFNGDGVSGRDEVTNNRTVYYDDFEFLE
ncbi:PKD-like domain-containing protein [Alistipes sp.]|uniref:PKD-like domain-containing protein n=1 Tax=Alistipes sp. TaxID=1872444 RepID=UPI003AB8BCD2